MSFVVAAPDLVQAAAQNLAGIRDTLAEANATAAAPTAGVVAAGEDEVSAAVAALFGSFGQEYQAISAQVQTFHEQFVNLLNAGAGAYLATEVANAEQNLSNAVGSPVQGLLGAVSGASGASGAVSAGLSVAQPAASSILGGLLGGSLPAPLLGGLGGGPVVSGLNRIVASLADGSVFALLPGQIGSGLQALSADIAALPTILHSWGGALAPSLLHAGASTGSAAGPYQTLLDNTIANLQTLGGSLSANPAPLLNQFVSNATGYANTIAGDIRYLIQNFPAVLAGLPANIQAAIQALLAFNPAPYVKQFIQNQLLYANIIATSLQNAGHDFVTGLQALPAAFQSAFQALLAGNIGGAVGDVAQGVANLFVTGLDVTSTGSLPGTLFANVALTGTLSDLSPIITIPGMRAQNLTNVLNVLSPGSIPAQISQNVTNLINTVTDTSLTAQVTLRLIPLTLSVNAFAGLPTALALDALGAPVNALNSFSSSASQFMNQLQTGDFGGAFTTLIDAPAYVADAFLNGQSTLPITFDVSGFPATLNLPLNGVLVPVTPYTATLTVGNLPVTRPVGGTPISGLATGLLVYAPQQLALAISP